MDETLKTTKSKKRYDDFKLDIWFLLSILMVFWPVRNPEFSFGL